MANIKKTKQNIQKFFYCFHKLDSSTFEKKTEKYKNKFIGKIKCSQITKENDSEICDLLAIFLD